MFQLSRKETEDLRSQFVTLNEKRKYYGKYTPLVFTEHGVTMLSSVLKSTRAIQVNILIVRAFIKVRELLNTHKDIIVEIDKIKVEQKKYGEQFGFTRHD